MSERLGDIRCSRLREEELPLLAIVTQLTERTVAGRVRKAHGNVLVRNLFADDWPYDAHSLAALNVAAARRAGLDPEIELVTGLTARTVRRRLDVNGRTLLQTAFPELLEERDDEVESDDELADRSRGRQETEAAPQLAPVELLGAAKVVSLRRAPHFIEWLAQALRVELPVASRRLEAAHGRMLIKTAFAEAWPPRKLTGLNGNLLGPLTAASVRRSPSLVRLVADVAHLPPRDVFNRFEDAQGNMRADSVVPELNGRPRRAEARPSPKQPVQGDHRRTDVVGGKYRLVRKLGQGGMGEVWEAVHLHLSDHRVVIKLDIKGNPETLEREIGTAYGLTHQNICAYKDVGRDPVYGTFLVLEHGGRSLERMLSERTPVDLAHAIDLVSQAAAGLDFAHDHGVVHQDIKPGNVLVEESGRGWRVRVADFGIALKGERGKNTAGNTTVFVTSPLGLTPAYAAPEQFQGQARTKSDQYSLALVFCSILEGRVFDSRYDFGWSSSLSHSQNLAVQRALSPSLESRFTRCSEFAQALTRAW